MEETRRSDAVATESVKKMGWQETEEIEEIRCSWDAGTVLHERYRLKEKIGVGGMGEVWRGTDQVAGGEVAIKFLVGMVDSDARHRFAAEVRVMARLDHPHIVSVLDQGEFEGAPYFVMTRLTGLSFAKWRRLASWENACLVFDQVLDALAYAHARGVIHRDLKPGNIIVTGPPEHPHAVVLDFGIALDPYSDGLVTGEIVGSPGYMAPEQRRGETWRARESTDLYAVGVLLYEIISGRSPFGKRKPTDLIESPDFLFPKPKFPMKYRWEFRTLGELVEPLLQRLLAPRLSDRPLLAADVREELTRVVERAIELKRDFDSPVPWDEQPSQSGEDQTELLNPWHPVYLAPRSTTSRPSPGASGIYGLRQPPVLGRDEELALMWKTARRAFTSGQPHVVFLEGINGIGKRHIATHLCERANEQGLARFVEISYLDDAPAASGVLPSLEQILRVRYADRQSARMRIEAWLEDEQADSETVAESMLGLLRPSGHGHRGRSSKHSLFLRALRAMCFHRAVIVLVHDIQWGNEEKVMEQLDLFMDQQGLPVLVLATVQVDAAETSFLESYAKLLEHPRVSNVLLGPLPEKAVRSLLSNSMVLDPKVEDVLVERSEGLPLLASQLLDELVREDALIDGPKGARLKPDRSIASIPSGLRSFWAKRISKVASEEENGSFWLDVLQGLSLARVSLTPDVLKAVGAALGEPLEEAIAALEHEGLLIAIPEKGVRFCHSELAREVAEKNVDESVAIRWNMIWAAALARLDEDHSGRYGLERGRHLMAAREPGNALSVLLSSAEQAFRWGDTQRTASAATTAQYLARRKGDRLKLAWAMRWQGGASLLSGDIAEAEKVLRKSQELFTQETALHGIGATSDALGWVMILKADYEQAVEICTYGADAYRKEHDEVGLATILGTLGYGLARVGRYGEARAVLKEAEEVATRCREDKALAGAFWARAVCARLQGDWDKSEQAYILALDIASRRWRALLPSLYNGLGLVELAKDNLDKAREHISKAFELSMIEGRKRFQYIFSADMVSITLLSGDEKAAVPFLNDLEKHIKEIADIRMVWSLERAWERRGQLSSEDIQKRLGKLLSFLYEKFDRKEDAQKVRDLLN